MRNDERNGAASFVTDRPVAVLMIIVAIAVFGFVSFGKLPVDLLPEISYPTLTVRTTYKGAAPADVEDRISVRLQEALSTLPKLVRATSISRAETSDVLLEFDWGTSMTFAVQDVRDKLDGVFLPQGAERPLILRYDPNLDPILRIGLTATGEGDEAARVDELIHLRWLAEKRIKRELESIPGVAAVQVRGGLEDEIKVRIDPFKMAAQQLDPAALAARLAAENINASGGLIREGSTEYLVRTQNEFRDLDEIADLAIEKRGAATIRVRDVASVERTYAEREVTSRIGGRESVEIAIYREAGANIVWLSDTVKRRVFGNDEERMAAREQEERGTGAALGERSRADFLAHRYRRDARMELLSDQSTFIRAAVDDVKSSAVIGSILAVVVILAFLRQLVPTAIIAISIPISVVVTFAPMYVGDVSLNIMSLGGLALGVGMLVDNAIVVLESITRCREEGDSLRTAAVRGVREVAGAITASTLTTVAVFAPIVFVHGIAGQMFGDQSLTVVASLLVSLLVAVLFIPMLASREWLSMESFARVESGDEQGLFNGLDWSSPKRSLASLGRLGVRLAWPSFGAGPWTAGSAVPRALGWLAKLLLGLASISLVLVAAALIALMWLLGKLLWLPGWLFDRAWTLFERGYRPVLAAALSAPGTVTLVSAAVFAWSLHASRDLGVELIPEIRQGEFTAHVALPIGTPLERTDAVLRELDARVREIPGVAVTALTVGVEKDTLTREVEGKHTARLTVRLAPEPQVRKREEEILTAVRELLASSPDVAAVDIQRPTPFAIDAPVTVEVLGHDLEALQRVCDDVFARLSGLEGLADVRTSVRVGFPELRVTFDRDKTLQYGLDLTAVSNLVRDQVLGNVSTRFTDGEEKIDVRVQGDEVELGRLERVMHLVVNPSSKTPVELRSIAELEPVQGPAEIRRIGNTRAVVVTGSPTGADLGGLAQRIERELASLELPDDVTVELGGQKREMDAAQSSMQGALLLALFLVYVVMACQFESLVQPLVILLSMPLAVIGVVAALVALSIPVSVIVFIGLILLAGIVVNNAIVLVDRCNQNRAAGMSIRDALLEAGPTRLRPIFMTTGTTVIGLLPMTGWLEGLPWIGALGAGEGAEIRAPMAITVIAGLSMSTLLTLVVIPALYAVTEGWLERLRKGNKAA
ncbi:MAG: efflux RND transporter permease subunit [Planctomycetota bacterium]